MTARTRAVADQVLVNLAPGTVTVWSDIGCPWASLALHTLRSRMRERGEEIFIDHRCFPLELFNSQPTPEFIMDAEVVSITGLRPELGWKPWNGPEWTYPGATYHWTAKPPDGFPRLEHYETDWADDLLDALTTTRCPDEREPA